MVLQLGYALPLPMPTLDDFTLTYSVPYPIKRVQIQCIEL